MSRGFPPQFRRGHPPAAVRPWVAGKSAAPVAVRWVATTVAHRWGIAAVVPMAERRVSGWWPVEAVVAGRSRACRSAAGRRWATLPRTGWAGVSTSSGVVARPNPGGGPLRSPAPDVGVSDMDSLGIVDVHDWHPTVIEVEPIEAAIVNGDPATLVESQQQVCPGDQGVCDADIRAQVTPDDDIVSCGERALRSLIPHGQHGRGGWLAHRHQLYRDRSRRRGGCTRSGKPTITPAVASANLLATFPSGLAGLLHAHSNRRFLLDGQRRLRRVSSGGHSRTGHGVLGQRPDGGVGALQRRAVGRRPGLGGAGAAEREAEGADGDNRSGRRCSRGVGGASRGRGRGGRARCARGGYRSGRAGRCGGPRPRRLRCTLVVSTLELPHGDRDGHHQQHRQHRGDDDGGPQQRAFRGRGHGDRLRHPRVVRITRAAQTMAECAREVDTPLVTVLGLLGQRFGEDRVQRCQLGNPIADRRG